VGKWLQRPGGHVDRPGDRVVVEFGRPRTTHTTDEIKRLKILHLFY